MAEWTDEGLTEEQLHRLRGLPTGLLAAVGIFAAMILIAPNKGGVVLVGVVLAVLWGASLAWILWRRKRPARMTLELRPDCLTLVRQSDREALHVELPRSDTGGLIGWASSRWGPPARLELGDSAGRSRLVLPARDVELRSLPVGMDPDALGLDAKKVPLAVLVGSWWPEPQMRRKMVKASRFSLADDRAGPWTEPDLAAYRRWKAGRIAREGLLMLGMGLVLLTELVAFGALGTRSDASRGSGDQTLALAAILAFCGAAIVYGLLRLWQAARFSRA